MTTLAELKSQAFDVRTQLDALADAYNKQAQELGAQYNKLVAEIVEAEQKEEAKAKKA